MLDTAAHDLRFDNQPHQIDCQLYQKLIWLTHPRHLIKKIIRLIDIFFQCRRQMTNAYRRVETNIQYRCQRTNTEYRRRTQSIYVRWRTQNLEVGGRT